MIEFDPILLHEWLRRSARCTPEKEALICGDERWSYRKLDACSDCLAEMFIAWGLRTQERVVICTGNCVETVVSLYAALKARGIFVVLEGNVKSRRLGQVIANTTPRILVANVSQTAIVREATANLNANLRIVWVGASTAFEGCVGARNTSWESLFPPLFDTNGGPYPSGVGRLPHGLDVDLACLIYTSCTSGSPKGVMCNHRDMVSAARSIIQYLDNRPEDVVLNVLPLSFTYGLYQLLMACMFGGTIVLEDSFSYPHLVLKHIAQEKVTGLPLVPSVAALMLRMESISEYDFHTLRYMTSAGAALPVSHLRSLRRLVPQAKLFNMYGLTECVRVSYLAGEELDQRPTSVGRPMPNCEVLIVDDHGNEVEPEDIGELIIRGSSVMQGYWRDPERFARSCLPGPYPASRWLRSGDYFRRDEEGFLYFVGRKDDMIKTRGERVSPKEVENVLCELEGVAEAAVIGVPDDILGRAIKAFLVAPASGLDEKTVLRHCAEKLSPSMVPKYVEFVPALPRNTNGKVDKCALQTVEGT